MAVTKTEELPINCAAHNAVWIYPHASAPRFAGAPVIFETTRSHQCPGVFSLPEGSDVTVELYGGACSLWLDGGRHRVHVWRFDFANFPTEEEARHAFMRLWREVERLESPAEIELAAERWLEARRGASHTKRLFTPAPRPGVNSKQGASFGGPRRHDKRGSQESFRPMNVLCNVTSVLSAEVVVIGEVIYGSGT
jgi:hypothetical protein